MSEINRWFHLLVDSACSNNLGMEYKQIFSILVDFSKVLNILLYTTQTSSLQCYTGNFPTNSATVRY